MPKNEIEPVNLGSIAKGAGLELFNINIVKVAENIADTNTDPKAKRTLILKFTFTPDIDRKAVDVNTTAEVRLAAVQQHKSRCYLGKSIQNQPLLFPQDPRMESLFDNTPEEGNVLDFSTVSKKPQ